MIKISEKQIVYFSAINLHKEFNKIENANRSNFIKSNKFHGDQRDFINQMQEPQKVINDLRKINSRTEENFFQCPATKDFFNNVFYTKVLEDMSVEVTSDMIDAFSLKNLNKYSQIGKDIIFHPSRPSNLDGYFSARLSQYYYLVSKESLMFRLTAPYYPCVSPAPYSIFSSGKYDIGKWNRPIPLEYHFKNETKNINFKKGDPLVFFEFETDKEIIFKKFAINTNILSIISEMSTMVKVSPLKSLSKRYETAQLTKTMSRLIDEINKNLL
ncbi:hypothetical protein EBU71_03855 [bacterium]|nr:hypothetical protein [Candidatus Elulimicrobium humile]